jgi:DNA polymerase-3 subunit delta'
MKHWTDIRGQDRPKKVLERALETGRVHHAYLFTGLQGVGKYTTSLAFAAIVNCEKRGEESFRDFCGECSSCRKIDQGYHPDVFTVAPEGGSSRIKIEQIRDIQESASKQPHEARYRMVLIDGAHEMTTEAANALLKTLEEPSSRMRLILVTNQAHQLLETIISRCQQLRFSGLDTEKVEPILREELEDDEEFEEMPDASTLELAAEYGEGSVGRSLSILTSGMLDERRDLIDAVLDRPEGRPAAMLDLADDLGSGNRTELERRLDVLKLFFRDVMLYKATGESDRLVNRDMGDDVADYASRFTIPELTDILEDLLEAHQLVDRQVNPQFLMEDLLPKLHPSD